MERIEYVPFKNPREVGWLMASLFDMYWEYRHNSFVFEWLERTPDLKVRCKDATQEKINFSVPPALLEAIHSCQYISAPTWLPQDDFGFDGFVEGAIYEIEQNVSITKPELFLDPLFWKIGVGIVVDYHRRIRGSRFFQHSHDHWSCTMRDHSTPFDSNQKGDRRDYILKTELIAATAIMYRQMNEMVYLPESQTHGARLRYKDGILIATCNPSEKLPELIFTLRAVYDLSRDNYDKNTMYRVIEWILSPFRPPSTTKRQPTKEPQPTKHP